MALRFAAVADDDTGATDLAGMLAQQGLRSMLLIDEPTPERLAALAQEADAVVLGVGSRAVSPAAAYHRVRTGIRLLRTLQPQVLQVKYCSTFDSTAEGNIGPSIDAAMDELDQPFTVALSALPVNGRTTYMGHHFVHQQLLSDSPMRHHPLTPMTNPNLVAHLQSQTQRRVGLASHPVIQGGVARLRQHLDQLRQDGVQIAVLDCTSDADLAVIGDAIQDLPLLTGSSALALAVPLAWQRRGTWKALADAAALPPQSLQGRGILIAAGSCSQATRLQNEWIESQGVRVLTLDGVALADGSYAEQDALAALTGELAQGRLCLVRTASGLQDMERVHAWAHKRGQSEVEVGLHIAYALAELVRKTVQQVQPEGLVIAGGETSGAVCRTLELGALRIGENIEPGVPLCLSAGTREETPALPVVLKSGNFGGPDFYQKAAEAIYRLRPTAARAD